MSGLMLSGNDLAPVLGVTAKRVRVRAQQEGWPFTEVAGRGGRIKLFEVARLPEDVRAALRRHQLAQVTPDQPPPAAVPAVAPSAPPARRKGEQMLLPFDAERPTVKAFQDRCQEARAAILGEVDRLVTTGMARSVSEAATEIAALAKAGSLAPALMELLPLANARAGKSGCRTLNRATILRWYAERAKHGVAALAPKAPPPPALPDWTGPLLREYCRPGKRALADCVRDLKEYRSLLPAGVPAPSYDQARRLIDKVGVLFRHRGRVGPRQMKAMRAYVSRDVSELWPSAIYCADGHTFDGMVRHPLTGKPFRPEITTIIDVFSRRAVGWSVGLAENTWGTLDALRHAVTTNACPDIWYVDRGKGFNNKRFDGDENAELLGFLGRLGITKLNSLPYNSQARGVIERLHQTIWVRGAKTLVTYMGADMDPEARHRVDKRMKADVKATGTSDLALPWSNFIEWCQLRVDRYNAQPHSSLPKVDGEHLSPDGVWQAAMAAGWEPDMVSETEALDLFRPYETRIVHRGLIELFTNEYFHRRLEQWHGIKVAVGYDIHDADRVWVRELDDGHPGRLIAVAEWDGHKRSFVPVPFAKAAHANRLDAQERRLLKHVGDVQDERRMLDAAAATPEAAPTTEAERDAAARMLASAPPPALLAAPTAVRPEPVQGGGRPKFADDYALAAWVVLYPDQATDGDRAILREALRSPLFATVLKARHNVDAATLRQAISMNSTTKSEGSIAHA